MEQMKLIHSSASVLFLASFSTHMASTNQLEPSSGTTYVRSGLLSYMDRIVAGVVGAEGGLAHFHLVVDLVHKEALIDAGRLGNWRIRS